MQNLAFIFGGLFGASAIILGAFGSHLLKKKWSKEILDSFEIGVKYQMYHALFLILLQISLPFNNTTSNLAVICTIIGVFLFSGSIYGICILKSRKLPVKFIGPLTPLGGLCLLLAWLFFIMALL
ncbi:uncharacterized membrane protein YgdD (TMEM256/DUF423 family) [Wenyingzhuangia heitensis]|uniref:Uncharacterized membrane protein YgdD (TMEM256/DUF423 family) n=1 Tax=Wenyingzhuangia heitensis TaxID=1487859 RepID=A0ABX0U8M6_9FLAO|nr:DUF423 domain-containing protein [Wenyingzhuangia heitensis]NIJ45202.1 uncharacterized membrane protein YgdD (TMEM256/DUF423 family) [Wenyingzhuangia heitensis]